MALICIVVLGVLSSFVIILLRKRYGCFALIVFFMRLITCTSGVDKDLDQWVFHPLLFNLIGILLPTLTHQIAET